MLSSRIIQRVLSVRCSSSTATAPLASTPHILNGSSGYKFDNERYGKNIVLVEGVRTPFAQSMTDYEHLMSYELMSHALKSLLKRIPISPSDVDYVVCGTNLHEPKTPNVAREAVLAAGLPMSVPANTVTMACVSANQAITSGIGYINSGTYEVVIAGGVETASDVPIRHSKKMRQMLLKLNKAKSNKDRLNILKKLRPDYFAPELPQLSEFFTGQIMGEASDQMSASFKVSRREQDEFGLRSHTLADKAFKEGNLSDIEPIFVPGKGLISKDNGIRVSTYEKVSKLKPSFTKEYGTATPANSSYFTDGATAMLIMTEEKAKELCLKPKAYLREHIYVSLDLRDQLLLGPAYAVSKLLKRANLKVSDIDVWEFHEAFAGQVLANLKGLDSSYFCTNYLGQTSRVGMPDMNRLNTWGGSLSIGHPFGATGVRLVTTAANRLAKENGRLAMVSACAGGGIGVGMIVESYP